MNGSPDRRSGLHPDRFPFLPPLAAAFARLHYRSCKFTIVGQEHEESAFGGSDPVLMTCWHFAFPTVAYRYRDKGALVMVSRSRDGEWAARVVARMGYRCFRGSPGKGGSRALLQMISHIQEVRRGGFIADGSQGPARIAQKGILLLARYSGAPLLPVSIAAHPCWHFRSWDRTVLPKPFARIVMALGPPMRVPHDISAADLKVARLELETGLNRVTELAEATLAGLRHV